jgi:hypothetical protein
MSTLLLVLPEAASLATVVGPLAVVIGASWPLLRHRPAMLAGQVTGAALFATHFALLGSTTGALTCLVSIAQTAASWRLRDRRILLAIHGVSLLLLVFSAFKTWHGAASVCALGGALLATIGRLSLTAARMRWWFLGNTVAWVGHNTIVGSSFGLASDLLTLTTTGIGICHQRRRARRTLNRRNLRLVGGVCHAT